MTKMHYKFCAIKKLGEHLPDKYYLCNRVVNANPDYMTDDWDKVTCNNCLRYKPFDENTTKEEDMFEHCLDKQRVKKAIEKCTHHVWGTILPNELFKELGMEK